MGPTRRLSALLARIPLAGILALATAATLAGCAASTTGSVGRAEPAASAVAGLFSQDDKTPASAPAVADRPQSSAATPRPQPCAGNQHAQYIRVSITHQHAWLCSGTRLAYDTAVTTGMSGPYTSTPTGTFQIQGRDRDTTLSPTTGGVYPVKYWIPFDAPLLGFHDSSWQHFPYGSARYRTDGSHGCVHMPLQAMKFLYDWVQIGATVRITA